MCADLGLQVCKRDTKEQGAWRSCGHDGNVLTVCCVLKVGSDCLQLSLEQLLCRPADAVLAEALSRLSVFAHDNAGWIESIDINPFVVLAKGQGAVAVDALIIPSQG